MTRDAATVASTARERPRRPPLTDIAYDALKRRILDNELPPGAQILEQEVALQLGMSRTPVHEAMIRLEQEGLVELVRRHGMRVLPISPEAMREIYQILAHLELLAIDLIAGRRPGAAETQALRGAARDMRAALDADDLAAWAEADERFHRHLFELSGNTRLLGIARAFWTQVHRARMLTLHLRPKPERSTRAHLRLVDVLVKGDGAAAREIHESQRQRSAAELIDILARCNLRHL